MAAINGDFLSKQIGPLPAGIWGLGVVAGGIFYYERKKTATANANATPLASAGSPLTDQSGGVGTGPGTAGWIATGPPTTPAGPVAPTTNSEWYTAVFTQLVAKGYDPALVDTALRRYLSEQQLDTADWVIVRLALVIYPLPNPLGGNSQNPPPKGPPKPVPVPKPLPKPPGGATSGTVSLAQYLTLLANLAKTRPRQYVIANGDTLPSIAGRFYGNQALWPNLYNANRKVISNPNVLHTGTIINLPAGPYAK